jgi:perosamine synthetase
VDINPHSLNLDADAVRVFLRQDCERTSRGIIHKATRRLVRAILPVHVFGMPCDMEALLALASEYGLSVLEDACEAIGAEYAGRRVGSFGNAAVFAFYPNKQITTGEGGMIVTNDSNIVEICRSLRNQGRDADGRWLKHVRLGYNYRMSDIHAALGLAQLERIEEILEARANVAHMYSEQLAGHELLKLPLEDPKAKRSWFVYVIQVQGPSPKAARDRLQVHLRSKGIATQVYFPAIHRQPYFREICPGSLPDLPETDRASETCLALPFSSQLTASQVGLVCDEILRVLDSETTPLAYSESSSLSASAAARP